MVTHRLTMWQQHKEDWKDCSKCPLHLKRGKVVLARGDIPSDVLLIGEAPGHGENTIGRPFVGPAGKLFDEILSRSIPRGVTYAITNLISCIPISEETGGKVSSPPPEWAVLACQDRLKEFVRICDGDNLDRLKLIVCVGSDARDWLDIRAKEHISLHRYIPQIAILHPSAMLRRHVALRMSDIQEAINNIARTIEEIQAGTYQDIHYVNPALKQKVTEDDIPF